METYATEGSFINPNLVTADEESQEFDDLIFALKTGEDCYFTLGTFNSLQFSACTRILPQVSPKKTTFYLL